ncbi:MAG: hypothetical protein B6A08_12670 [Sorangiineae bacterium NIC37A_2]|nr:MAG: hypothetical protein B6A08_12670 [Sorangiineae bacterium NIC37A_2]
MPLASAPRRFLDKRPLLLAALIVGVGCAYPLDFPMDDEGSGGKSNASGGQPSGDGGSANPESGGQPTSGGSASGGAESGGAPSSGGAAPSGGSATGGGSSGGAPTSGGAPSGGALAVGGAAPSGGAGSGGGATGGAPAVGGAPAGGAPGAGGGPSDPSCTCSLTWVSAMNIPALDTGDCIGYMGTLYRYEPENPTSQMSYCDPNCPPNMSSGDNCKWHAKLVAQGPCP